MNHIADGGQSSLTQGASTGELAPLSSGVPATGGGLMLIAGYVAFRCWKKR
jgi:hypothetical protein